MLQNIAIFIVMGQHYFSKTIINCKIYAYKNYQNKMHFRSHLQDLHDYYVTASHHHPQIGLRFLYFLVPYAILLAISFAFYRKSLDSQSSFAVDPMPSHKHQTSLYYAVVISLGLSGLFAAVGNYWTTQAWILFLFATMLLAVYIFLYQLVSMITLFFSMIASIGLAANLEWLFIETGHMGDEALDLIIRNLIGVAGAWALVFCILTMGQVIVHSCSVQKKVQSVCFFITTIALLTLTAIWNMDHYCKWSQAIGFIAMGATIMSFSAVSTGK